MRYQQVLEEIVGQSGDDEDPADILTMVHLTEPFVPRQPERIQQFEAVFPMVRQDQSQRSKSARIAGTLLCLLFAPVKQENYRRAMREVRKEYRGIAEEIPLQVMFSNGLRHASKVGAFRSFREAEASLADQLMEARGRSLATEY